ncbi:MAG: FAD-dependent oxidoreductase [Planctomycetaceae bacterium]|nr:FAD-dependent oxidoreductase [Planctomycetaceae bacterium]
MPTTLHFIVASLLLIVNGGRAPAVAGEPLFATRLLFPNAPQNKPNYRIPAIIQGKNGTLLVFAEKRNDGPGDVGDHDIVLKRSMDRGATWSDEIVLFDDERRTSTDITVGRDETNGKLWLFFLRDKKEFCCFTSDDDGRSWQGPRSLHNEIVKPEWDRLTIQQKNPAAAPQPPAKNPPQKLSPAAAWQQDWQQRYGVGPGKAMVSMAGGPKPGRLVVPARRREDTGGGRLRTFTFAFYSDDHGVSWRRGGSLGIYTSECQFVELADGKLMAVARNESASDAPDNLRHLVAVSDDAGETWGEVRRGEELITPRCHGAVERLSLAATEGKNRLLFSSPASPIRQEEHPYGRYNLTVRLSYDEGETWSAGKTIWPHPSSYSDLVRLDDGTIAYIYERGDKGSTHYWDELHFARFNLEWLTDGRDSLGDSTQSSRSAAKTAPQPQKTTVFKPDVTRTVLAANDGRSPPVTFPPTVDLSADAHRQTVIAAGTPTVYQGHPTTVLLPDGKTMFCTWTYGHGGGCGPLKRSDDAGRTWSELLDVPESWTKVKNCPSLYRLTGPDGAARLFVFAGQGPDGTMHSSRSLDDGRTWTPMRSTGLKGVMPFCTIVPIDGGKRLLGLTNIRRPGEPEKTKSNVIAQSTSADGGLTWEPLKIVLDLAGLKPCEPCVVRSPDGKQLLCLMRENVKRRSFFMTSDDEGRTWSPHKTLPPGLWGDRHMATYARDGRLVVCFRDTGPGSPTASHFVAWVGRYEDIIAGHDGAYRIKLLHSHGGRDCGYPGLELLPSGELYATTYIKYRPGEDKHSVVSTRFSLAETDALAQAAPASAAEAEPVEVDVLVFGGTSGGVAAAVQAARMGKSVALLEPGRHLGGMTSGGLSAVDIGDPRSVGGIAREYFTRLVKRYGKELAWEKPFVPKGGGPATGGAYSIEPHTAEEVFVEMARAAKVQVFYDARLAAVAKVGARITEIKTEDGRTFRAKMFVDTTYEGDLMAKAGVSYTVEREGNAKYGERYNGVYFDPKYEPRLNHLKPGASGRVPGGQGVWDRDLPLDPYVKPGDPRSGLLPLVTATKVGNVGDPAPGVQAYCYRLCLTTSADRLPIAPPEDYDPRTYELVARFIAGCREIGDDMDLRWFSKHDALPNDKWDFNTATFGGNLPGANWEWPEATYARRAELAKQHENYHRGLLHFLATDERVPSRVRDDMRRFGLPRDEFQDTGGWPHQLYIREARRMVSDLVLTEHHTFGRRVAPKSVGLGSYGTDTHEIQRIVVNGIVTREGKTAGGRDGAAPYQIGYEAIVPKAAECENLFCTFALSASHTAFSSIRMEPVLMITSQSAATAAAIAVDDDVAVQQVDYDKLRARLERDGQVIEWKHAAGAAKKE